MGFRRKCETPEDDEMSHDRVSREYRLGSFTRSSMKAKWAFYQRELGRLADYRRFLSDWPALIESLEKDAEWMRSQIPDSFVMEMYEQRAALWAGPNAQHARRRAVERSRRAASRVPRG